MYCTIKDLQDQTADQVLITLTDDEGAAPESLDEAGEAIHTRLTKAILDATNEINSYCQARYPVPLDPVPGFINKLTVDIALYNLFSRRGYDESTADKAIIDRYKAAVKNLENISRGLVTLGAAAPPVSQDNTTVINSGRRLFSRDKLREF